MLINSTAHFSYTTTIRVSEQEAYQTKTYSWCFSVPPRCTSYKVNFRTVFKTQKLLKYRPVEECCAGYAPDSKGEVCVPICVEPCVHGKCVAPNTCACAHGFGGPACDICKYFLTTYLTADRPLIQLAYKAKQMA